ncbi:unnamed protein product [Rotaria socialis]
MIKTLILLVASIAVIEGSYSCAQSNGTFQNDDDYRSYHVCTYYCDRITYCLQTNEYYSAIERTCKRGEFNWLPGYDLTGTELIMPLVQYRHFQQSGYDVYWTSETLNHQFDFIGRYINETHVMGTETILSLRTKCVLIYFTLNRFTPSFFQYQIKQYNNEDTHNNIVFDLHNYFELGLFVSNTSRNIST